jgi:signal transduction histidine kinase/CheY-like chemotaxis protein
MKPISRETAGDAPLAKSLGPLYRSLIVAALLSAALVAATVWLGVRARDEDGWVRHTLAVRNQIQQILILVQRVETTQRGYLLTNRERYLEPFQGAATALPSALEQAATLVVDNPKQQSLLGQLGPLIEEKLNELQSTLDKHRAGDANAAMDVVNSDEGLRLMDEIRRLIAAMLDEEDRLLASRQADAGTFAKWLLAGAGTALLLVFAVCVLASFLARRSFVQLAASRDSLAAAHQGLLTQISRREQVENQLRQSQKMEAIGQLTGGIAHDFNNMLSVILGSIDLMQRRIKKGDLAIDRFLDAVRAAAERAATLTHRLLAFARQQPLSPEPVDANRLIANMSDLLRSTLGEHIRIETVSAAGLWTSRADLHQLENAILNIAINSRDAMPEGGKLTIETANAYLDEAYCRQHAEVDPGQFVMIAISDTGTGMAPEIAARAFDPFYTTKPPGKGTGLGLSQVFGFVKQSRGHIKIYSEPGAGTTVKVYLPRLVGETKAPEVSSTATVQRGRAGEAILVVEDDPLVRKVTTDALRELGYSVQHAAGALEALAILERAVEIKLLFTDVVMPDIDGKRLADEAVRRRPDLKVLYTTGYTPNAVVHGGVLDPGVDFISKPFTLEQLGTKLRAVLDA